MNRRFFHGRGAAMALCLAWLMAGCVRSGRTRYYTLAALAPAAAGAPAGVSLGLGPVRVARHLRQPAMIRRHSAYELQHCDFDLWGEPVEDGITRVLADNLARLTDARYVLRSPWPAAESPQRRIDLTVDAFELDAEGQAELRVRWEIRDAAGALLGTASTRLTEPAGGDTGRLPDALSRTLLTLSRELAAALRR